MMRVDRPDPSAPTRSEVKAHLAGFPDRLDALLTRNIERSPRRLRELLRAAKETARANWGAPRAIIIRAVNTRTKRELYDIQMRPYRHPSCKGSGCEICGFTGWVMWEGSRGEPR